MAAYSSPAPKRGMPVWLIVLLIVIALVVLIVGTLGVLAVVGVKKYIGAAKQVEAISNVGMIALDGSSAYTRERAVMTGPTHRLCGSASKPVPVSMASVTGKKYVSMSSEWTVDAAADAGFACLSFEMMSPQYYQYDYKLDSPTAFTVFAHGDLDGNGVTSEFTQRGRVVGSDVVLDPSVTKKNPEE